MNVLIIDGKAATTAATSPQADLADVVIVLASGQARVIKDRFGQAPRIVSKRELERIRGSAESTRVWYEVPDSVRR